ERRFRYVAGVERNSHRFASRPAMLDPVSGRRWTYADLCHDAGRLAAGLHRSGVAEGDVVVFQLFNSPEFALVAVVRVAEDPDRPAGHGHLVARDGTEVGEVIVRSVKSGYADVNAPGEQAARLPDGWLYTGDLATWDADEYVTIVGRKDDMI